MRLFKKKTVLVVLLLISGLYFTCHLDLLILSPTKSHEQFPNKSSQKAERLLGKESWVEEGDYLPLNVSYELLAGEPSTQKKYLAVGLSSVKRIKGSYLLATLQSIFSQSSLEELSSMVVVVLLADFDASWRVTAVSEIKAAFATELALCQLVVLHVPQEWYPPLTGLKRNYNDPSERVTFRSKQNVDYSFLMHYSAGLSRYYLQLEDDVSCAKNFLTQIKRRVQEQEAKKTTWAMLEFSVLGYIGKLYKSAHVPLLARFLFLFYQEMPCDWLMSHFRVLLTQKEPIMFKPSLFQHMGTFSSFQGGYNHLKDKDFKEGFNINPSAEVFSDMSTYQEQFPKLAWEDGEGYFWALSPKKGNYLTVVLTTPAVLTSILVETGSDGHDLLQSGQVEIGHNVVTNNKEKTCQEFQSVGTIVNGRFDVQDLEKKYSSPSSCLRILVTEGQHDWLRIRNIKVSTK